MTKQLGQEEALLRATACEQAKEEGKKLNRAAEIYYGSDPGTMKTEAFRNWARNNPKHVPPATYEALMTYSPGRRTAMVQARMNGSSRTRGSNTNGPVRQAKETQEIFELPKTKPLFAEAFLDYVLELRKELSNYRTYMADKNHELDEIRGQLEVALADVQRLTTELETARTDLLAARALPAEDAEFTSKLSSLFGSR